MNDKYIDFDRYEDEPPDDDEKEQEPPKDADLAKTDKPT